jgi:hypothetical protein
MLINWTSHCVGIRFYAADPADREFILANGKMFGEFDDEYMSGFCCTWISLDMPFGTILRSFEWCHEKRSIVRAIFQEKPKKALMTSLARAGGNEGDSRCRQERR